MATTITKEETTKTSKVNLTPNSLTVLKKRYLVKNEHGEPCEQPEDMFWRVSLNVAQADLLYNPDADVDQPARRTTHCPDSP